MDQSIDGSDVLAGLGIPSGPFMRCAYEVGYGKITRGSGNILPTPGNTDAEERQTKLRLAHAIKGLIAGRRLT
jgi:hypothetical protein